jgi:transglutaminase-like putative cysteine protease
MRKLRKGLFLTSVILTLSVGACLLLSRPSTTHQGVNYQVSEHTLPLYLKLLSYFHHHYEYRNLAQNLVGQVRKREEKIQILFDWTREHIRPVPKELPIVDDHIWDIIVRGYGTQDQAADVFAALCAYAGIPAHFEFQCVLNTKVCLAVAFVEGADGEFGIYDPRTDVIIRNNAGEVASLKEIRTDLTLVERAAPNRVVSGYPYARFFEHIPEVSTKDFSRTTRQMPGKRLLEFILIYFDLILSKLL